MEIFTEYQWVLKIFFDTIDMPTEDGTEIHKKNPSLNDCTVVSKLKQAGAIIMGKTVTTELAYYSPGKTKNPHDLSRTPGGSSSGSAAAVASHMVPLAIGSQNQWLGNKTSILLWCCRL